jgi:hypothetical protein
MTRIYAFICALALASLIGGCGITGPVPPPGTPGIVACSDTALHEAELSILPNVETALASANWEQALLSLVAGIGGPLALQEVSCAVQWVEAQAEKSGSVTADSLEATKAAHAIAWLAKHPVAQ